MGPVLPNSLKIRSVHFAFLFGPPRLVEREEASTVYNKVCEALGQDDLGFKYNVTGASDRPDSKGFAVLLEREEGRGGFRLTLENTNVSAPMRLMMEYAFPPSGEMAPETFDAAAGAVFKALEGRWQLVVAEARLRAQCAARNGTALDFMIGDLMRVNHQWLDTLGKPLSMATAKFEIDASPTTDSLAGPKRELTFEILREDRKSLYIELVSQWTRFPSITAIDPSNARPIDRNAGEYIKEAIAYLKSTIVGLAKQAEVPND